MQYKICKYYQRAGASKARYEHHPTYLQPDSGWELPAGIFSHAWNDVGIFLPKVTANSHDRENRFMPNEVIYSFGGPAY